MRYVGESSQDISAEIESIEEASKKDWVITNARQYGGDNKTAVITVNNTNKPELSMPTSTPVPKKDDPEYDLDKDLVVVLCKRDDEKKTMYHIAFAEIDENGEYANYYTFYSIINPRAMGKQFNAIGDLPSWFYEGATVHVQANLLSSGELSSAECMVTETKKEVELSSVPDDTPSATMSKEYTAEEIASAVDVLLSKSFSSSIYRIETVNDAINIYFTVSGTSETAYYAANGNTNAKKTWNETIAGIEGLSTSLAESIRELGNNDVSAFIYLMDDLNEDNVLAVVWKGNTYFDVVNGINLLN